VSASEALNAVAPDVDVDLAAPEEVVADPDPVEDEVPAVPLVTVLGARLAVALAARALKLASDRVAFAFVFSLMTKFIPAWQCFACEQ